MPLHCRDRRLLHYHMHHGAPLQYDVVLVCFILLLTLLLMVRVCTSCIDCTWWTHAMRVVLHIIIHHYHDADADEDAGAGADQVGLLESLWYMSSMFMTSRWWCCACCACCHSSRSEYLQMTIDASPLPWYPWVVLLEYSRWMGRVSLPWPWYTMPAAALQF